MAAALVKPTLEPKTAAQTATGREWTLVEKKKRSRFVENIEKPVIEPGRKFKVVDEKVYLVFIFILWINGGNSDITEFIDKKNPQIRVDIEKMKVVSEIYRACKILLDPFRTIAFKARRRGTRRYISTPRYY